MKRVIIISLLIGFMIFYLFFIIGQINVTAEFKELEPFKHKLPVYYKGFKLGHTTRVHPGADYTTTLVDMRLRMKDLELPENTSAIIRRKDKTDYIELIYPNAPYLALLKNNITIEGSKGLNFETFIQEQAKNGGLDEIKDNVNGTIQSAGETFKALTEMINVLIEILEDARPTITDTVENINITSKNLAESSYNVRTSIQQGYIDKSLYNMQETTQNLVLTTKNITNVTDNVNKNSVNLINCVIKNINTVINNINEIVIGIGSTLKKRFGGLRLVFGKTIK